MRTEIISHTMLAIIGKRGARAPVISPSIKASGSTRAASGTQVVGSDGGVALLLAKRGDTGALYRVQIAGRIVGDEILYEVERRRLCGCEGACVLSAVIVDVCELAEGDVFSVQLLGDQLGR